jgi:hypothetical protein
MDLGWVGVGGRVSEGATIAVPELACSAIN